MTNAHYSLASSTWGREELSAMYEVIESGHFTMGERVRQFEHEFANKFGSKYAVMSNSGSSANLLAVSAMRYRRKSITDPRDEVIVPAVSWSTTYYPVHQLGYKLRFVDIDPGSLNASVASIERAINSNTAGILVVNLLGNPSDLPKIRQLADANDIFLIEDNCESMGAQIDGKSAGTWGEVGTFSTFFSHHISTMEGGVCVTDDEELAQIMTSMRAHGWVRELPKENHVFTKSGNQFEDSFKFVLPGYNLRPLELSGALGSQQLLKLDSFISERRSNAMYFRKIMADIPGFDFQIENGQSSWFGFSMVLTERNEGKRGALVEKLAAAGIESRPIVAGDFTQNPVIKHLNHAPLGSYPTAANIQINGLFVGNHHYPLIEEIQHLGDVLQDFGSQN